MNGLQVVTRAPAWLQLLLALPLAGCAGLPGGGPASAAKEPAWVELLGSAGSSDRWAVVGDADWRWQGGSVSASTGDGFLVSREAYPDFELRVEFRAAPESNSGIFLRCQDAASITPKTCYEINIVDSRPRESYATGSIVDVAIPAVAMKTDGKWSTLLITASGKRLSVVLNGVKSVEAQDTRLANGLLALQHRGPGLVEFRRVQIRKLSGSTP